MTRATTIAGEIEEMLNVVIRVSLRVILSFACFSFGFFSFFFSCLSFFWAGHSFKSDLIALLNIACICSSVQSCPFFEFPSSCNSGWILMPSDNCISQYLLISSCCPQVAFYRRNSAEQTLQFLWWSQQIPHIIRALIRRLIRSFSHPPCYVPQWITSNHGLKSFLSSLSIVL